MVRAAWDEVTCSGQARADTTKGVWMQAVTLYDWLLFGHVLAAMVWVGGALLLSLLAWQALRSTDEQAVDRFVVNLRVIGPRVFAPSVVLLLAFGIWMVLDSSAWDFDQTWLQIGMGLFAAAFLIGVVFLSQTAIRAERAVTRHDHADAVRHLRLWSRAYTLVLVLLIGATWVMVTKPGL
jgi:uncharacterized membrane protein